VIVETSRPEALRDGVHTAGGHVERRWQNRVQVTVPRARMSALAKLDGVTSVQAPPTLVEYAVSGEEAAASLAAAWHAKGFTGKGIKVAVIDGGFAGLAERQASGDLPANVVTADFCGGGINGPDDHGTAVAEIVHEMAPDAALYAVHRHRRRSRRGGELRQEPGRPGDQPLGRLLQREPRRRRRLDRRHRR
jgi:hypothetical protein